MVDTALILLSLLSFGVLVVIWVAAPLHAQAEEPSSTPATEPARHIVAA